MRKTIVSPIILMTLFTTGVLGGLLQHQDARVESHDGIWFVGGPQAGQSLQNLVVDNRQSLLGIADQSLFGSIGQALDVAANCGGIIAADIALEIRGYQVQEIGDGMDPFGQCEDLGVGFGVVGGRAEGAAGITTGLHTIIVMRRSGQRERARDTGGRDEPHERADVERQQFTRCRRTGRDLGTGTHCPDAGVSVDDEPVLRGPGAAGRGTAPGRTTYGGEAVPSGCQGER